MKTPRPPWLLVLCVLALHLWLGQEVQRIQEGWQRDVPPPMPPRMQVDFVREMVLKPPPAVARVALPPPAKPVRGAAAAAPEPLPMPMPEPPASAPESVAEAPAVASPEPVAVAASAPAGDEPGPEWPLSTRLSYVLTGNYRGSVHGQAQVEWLRQGRDYQVHLDVGVGPSFAPLISRRMSSQGKLTPEGIAPQRYDEQTRVILGDARRATVVLQGAEVQLANGARQPVARGAQDSASQFVQLTWLFLTGREPLEAGRVINFPLVLPYRQYAWQYQIVGEELLDTPMGPVASWHLKPTRGVAGGDLLAEVWLAPSLQFLPVRLVIRQDADTYIDLMLKSAPLQAAPESANDIPQEIQPMTYECILTSVHGDGPRKTGLITLNRPKALNALNDPLMDELGEALLAFDADDGIGCIVLTGSERAFAAGADIPTMLPHTFVSAFTSGLLSKNWETILQVRKPVIAAVAGYALGGGCELAMMCDFIIAADTAKFGQPEVKLGVVPGAGGSQRLPRAVGKSKAMDMMLTSRMMDAVEAERAGLVSRIVPADKLLEEALGAAETINGFSAPSVALIKELVNLAYQTPLRDGVAVERRYFHALFGSHDQREGMEAFLAKRAPKFEHR